MISIHLIMLVFASYCYLVNAGNGQNPSIPNEILNSISAIMEKHLNKWTENDIIDFITTIKNMPIPRGFLVNFFQKLVYESKEFETLKRENKWTRSSCVYTYIGAVTETFQEYYYPREKKEVQAGIITEKTHLNSAKYHKCLKYLSTWTQKDYEKADVDNTTTYKRTIDEMAKQGINKEVLCREAWLIYEIRCGFTHEFLTKLEDAEKFNIPVTELKCPKFTHRGVGFTTLHGKIINIMAYAINNLDRVEVFDNGKDGVDIKTTTCR